MTAPPTSPTLAGWVCLGVVADGPTHGWAVARELRPDAELGRIWHASRGATYRELDALVERGWIAAVGDEAGPGPRRTVLAVTDIGRSELHHWIDRPVDHLRDVRSALLVKLALAERLHRSPTTLLRRQRRVIDDVITGMTADEGERAGRDIVAAWRLELARAARRFVDAELAATER